MHMSGVLLRVACSVSIRDTDGRFGFGRTFRHCIRKGETAEGTVSVPVIWFLGHGRICRGLSHQWSAITGYEEFKVI